MKLHLLLFLAVLCSGLSAQDCASLYFYRLNGALQKDTTLVLMTDGSPLAVMNLGTRYQATVCDERRMEFVVKISPQDQIYASKTVDIQPGNDYYFRVGIPLAVYIPSIRDMEANKGIRDLGKGGRFTGPMQTIDVDAPMQLAAVPQSEPTGGGGGTYRPGGSGQPGAAPGGININEPVVMSNFRFEMTELRKSGGLVEMDFKITNLAPEDRQLKACPDMMYLYDDLGNFYHPAQVCISQSCRDGIGKKVGVKTEFYCSYGVRAEAMMPSGIPLNGKVVIKDVNNRATKFVRANWILQSEQALELQYGDIIFPDGVDDDNPNRQIAGKQTYTLLDAKRKGREVHVRLSAFNRATQPHPLTITGVTAYDDQGSVLGAKSIRFGKGGTPVIADRYRGWQHSLPGTESVPLTLIVEEVPTAATQLLRLDVDFGDYTLHWSDVPIAGGGGSRAKADATASGGPSPAGNDYMEYENFKREAKEIERVVDKHVILDHIYFDSGSDNLLSTSFAQLDDLAATLNQYPDLRIEISGHTDNVGAKTSNMLLSQKRADAVKYYLIAHNVPPARMESVGFGDTRPISGNTTDEGKQDNRRVEIRVVR